MIAVMNNQTLIDETAPRCAWPNCSQPARVSVDATSIDIVCDRIVSRYFEPMKVCVAHLAAYRDATAKPSVPVAIPLEIVDWDYVDLRHDCGIRSTGEVLDELRRLAVNRPAAGRMVSGIGVR